MRTHIPWIRNLSLTALPLAALLLAGCNDDTIVYVEDDPPAVPTGVYTITGDRQVEVRWNPVRQDDVAGYGVYRSPRLNGEYRRIATLRDPLADRFLDRAVVNGVTYYYAVDAFDHAGNESALSYEAAFDTPRPAKFGERIFVGQAVDWSDWNNPGQFITSNGAPDADVEFLYVGGILYARGTFNNGTQFWNDIQDMGWTATFDDVSWSPEDGWSVAPNGVELILGHTYVVWTHDSFFAKFRVTSMSVAPGGIPANSSVIIDWGYQIDPSNPELSPHFAPRQQRADQRSMS